MGTAINSTKVMTAQQVVKTEDGEEVRTARLSDVVYLKLLHIKLIYPQKTKKSVDGSVCVLCICVQEVWPPCLWLRLIHIDMIS